MTTLDHLGMRDEAADDSLPSSDTDSFKSCPETEPGVDEHECEPHEVASFRTSSQTSSVEPSDEVPEPSDSSSVPPAVAAAAATTTPAAAVATAPQTSQHAPTEPLSEPAAAAVSAAACAESAAGTASQPSQEAEAVAVAGARDESLPTEGSTADEEAHGEAISSPVTHPPGPTPEEGSPEKEAEETPEKEAEETPEKEAEGSPKQEGEGPPEEGALSAEEFAEMCQFADLLKGEGNALYGAGRYQEAESKYCEALEEAPLSAPQRSVYLANVAACKIKMRQWEAAVEHCTLALQVDPGYVKALMRRCQAFQELDDVDHALADAQQVSLLSPADPWSPPVIASLQARLTARQEALKGEMLGKLKDLGNTILGKFGMSIDNFKADQDPATGSYSIRYEP